MANLLLNAIALTESMPKRRRTKAMDPEVKKELANVEGILHEIRANTATPWWRSMLNGLLYGAGWMVGTIGAFAALGWILSIFGIIPGFDQIAVLIQGAMNHKF